MVAKTFLTPPIPPANNSSAHRTSSRLLLPQGMTSSKRRVKQFDNAIAASTVDAFINAEAIAINTAQAAVRVCRSI